MITITETKISNKLITLCDLGVGGERGLVFSLDGICPSESATQYKDAIKVLEIIRLDENGNECETEMVINF